MSDTSNIYTARKKDEHPRIITSMKVMGNPQDEKKCA